MKIFIAITATAGLALTAVGAWNLKRSEAGISYHHNPFALHESAYGKLLAELSQDTVDKVWHLGIEQVNPVSHDHSGHGHDHGDDHHGHDHASGEACETCNKAEQATKLLSSATTPAKEEAPHAEDGHSDHPDHDHSSHADHDDHSGHDHSSHAAHGHKDHVHDENCDHDDHHVHDEHCGHDHGGSGLSLTDAITAAKDFLVDLKGTRYERTNRNGISEAHKKHIAGEIEQMLLRSYQMDPTNYGVYNGYYLFLTAHDLRSGPAAIEHARKISHLTIGRAQAEDTAPGPWLTAEMALLNLFLLDQADWRKQKIDPPVEKLKEYREFSAYCKQQFEVLKQRAIADGRWEMISPEKREEMDERQYFANKTFEQFDVLIARYSKPDNAFPDLLPKLPVATTGDNDEE